MNWASPSIAIILETAIWPNLYNECGCRDIPLVMASARVSPKSVRGYRWLVSLFRDTLSHGIVIAAQSRADADRFVSIGANPDRTHVTGNIKFDFQLTDGVREHGEALRAANAAGRPVWIAASTHTGEEEIVLDAHRQARQTLTDALLVLVPRHPERFQGIATMLEERGFKYARHSRQERCIPATQVLLVDTMGELMAFYAASDVAFVGGSLVDIGGHNLLEPAALSLPMITGPHNYNAQDIADLFIAANLICEVDDATSLAAAVVYLLQNPDECADQGEGARSLIENNRGTLDRLMVLIEPLLD